MEGEEGQDNRHNVEEFQLVCLKNGLINELATWLFHLHSSEVSLVCRELEAIKNAYCEDSNGAFLIDRGLIYPIQLGKHTMNALSDVIADMAAFIYSSNNRALLTALLTYLKTKQV